jgi:NitT/TauT family transport system substrate-binding protein
VARRYLSALLAVSLILFAAAASAGEPPKHKVTITYGGDGMHYFPIYLARAAGFFAEEGIDVDWVNVNSGTRQAASIMGGSADLSPAALIHVIASASKGGDLVAIASLFDVYAVQLVLSKEAIAKVGITPGMAIDEKIRRMRGLGLGVSSPGSGVDAFVRSIFLARGLDPDATVTLQPFGTGTAILAAFQKQLTAGFAYPAPIPQMAVTQGLGEIVVDPFTGELPELNGTCFVSLATSRETLATKPEMIAGALRAITKAMRFAHEQPAETRRLMRQYFPDLEQPVYDLAIETYRKAVPKTPVLTREQVEKTIAWMNLGASQKIQASYEDVFAPGPALQAAHDLLTQ